MNRILTGKRAPLIGMFLGARRGRNVPGARAAIERDPAKLALVPLRAARCGAAGVPIAKRSPRAARAKRIRGGSWLCLCERNPSENEVRRGHKQARWPKESCGRGSEDIAGAWRARSDGTCTWQPAPEIKSCSSAASTSRPGWQLSPVSGITAGTCRPPGTSLNFSGWPR